ncbi:MAG: hypothetical protein OXE58_08210 [Acidobacteria bacterium]|nr:hypothetical protein [Acidobacteriota bacterium]
MRPARWLWPSLLGIAAVLLILRPWAGEAPAPPAAPDPLTEAEALYEEAIGDLESALRSTDSEGFGDLHAAMEQERQALDAAIADSRRRAAAAPGDEEAQETLFESLRRKLDLFHNTLMLMRDMERGDSETAQDRIDAISGRERPDTD